VPAETTYIWLGQWSWMGSWDLEPEVKTGGKEGCWQMGEDAEPKGQ